MEERELDPNWKDYLMTQPDHQDATQLMENLREAAKKMTPQDRMRQKIEYAVMSTAPDDTEAQNRIRRELEEQYGLPPAA